MHPGRGLIFLFVLLAAGLFYTGMFLKGEKSMNIKAGDQQFKTICVGRFIIDVPMDALVRFKGTYFAGWNVAVSSSSAVGDINDQILFLEKNLLTQKNEKNKTSLEKIVIIKNEDRRGAIFVYDRRWFDRNDGDHSWVSEIVHVRAFVKIKDAIYTFEREFGRDHDDEYLAELIKKMGYRENDEAPRSEGYCIERGFFYGMGRVQYTETTAVSIVLKDHPDVAVVFSTAGNINSPKPLIQRDKNDLKDKYRWRFHVIRKGGRSIDGMPGDEIVETVNEPNGTHSQSFMWESYGKREDIYLPVMSFELNSGHGQSEPVNSSLSDQEALALWERMSASIRRRPFAS